MNNDDLYAACKLMYNQDNSCKPSIANSKVSDTCETVDHATIAFVSLSTDAEIDTYTIVSTHKTANNPWFTCCIASNRSVTITPALTNVLLCTNADTGVGALIAAGNHDVNGNTAHLVSAYNRVNSKVTDNQSLTQIVSDNIASNNNEREAINMVSLQRLVSITTILL